MEMKNALRLLSCASLIALNGVAQAVTITDLNPSSGLAFVATSINNAGTIAGNGTVNSPYDTRAYVYRRGTFSMIPTLVSPQDRNTANDINNKGQVVGASWYSLARTGYAYLYDSGKVIDLAAHTNERPYGSVANAINDSGQVVGNGTYMFNSTWLTVRAFLYEKGVMVQLGTLQGKALSTDTSYATGINTRGQVVGFSTYGPENNRKWRAFSYEHGTMSNLGTLPDFESSYALGVNNAGQIVGYLQNGNGPTHAFLYSHGSMTDIGAIGGVASSKANAINSRGQVVGGSWQNDLAFLYENGKFTDLNSLPEVQAAGWHLTSAVSINDRGQIVGTGIKDGQTRSYLLTL